MHLKAYEVSLRRDSGLADFYGTPIREGDVVEAYATFEDDEEYVGRLWETMVVKYGECGGVKNVNGPVGYIGFYFESTNEESRLYGARTDPLYWLNAFRCKVVSEQPFPTPVWTVWRAPNGDTKLCSEVIPLAVTGDYLIAWSRILNWTNPEDILQYAASSSDRDKYNGVPGLCVFPLENCFGSEEEAIEEVKRGIGRA